jgi:ribose transport system permease protein
MLSFIIENPHSGNHFTKIENYFIKRYTRLTIGCIVIIILPHMRKELAIFILLMILCFVVAFFNPRFLGEANLQNTARLIGMYGIFSIGLGLVIITGGVDLSVGSVLALLGALLSIMLVDLRWPTPLAVGTVLALAIALGCLHGLLITKLNIQPFIVTLCGLLFYRGITRFISNDETKGFGAGESFATLRDLSTASLFNIPMPFILLIIVSVIMWVVLHRSVYGRYLFAVGRNDTAAKYSGINSDRVTISAYVLCTALTGIAAILIAFYTNSISPASHGISFELYGIAAAVVGGCSLRGGEGSIIGILIGTALLQVLQNLVNLLGIPSSLNFAVMGAVILVGVIADQLFQRSSAKA